MSGSDLRQRLAAILAADAVGYSRLMSLDERATVNALDAARKVFRTHIESNQGRVIDMAGDSVLALFETATGAVSAALAVQAEINPLADVETEERRMRFRIGVHLGDVIEKSDGTVYGDGINIAARLEGLAEPGGITISDALRGAVKGKVNAGFEDQGEQTVKNIADPVRTFRLRVGAIGVETPAAKPSRSAAEIDLSLPDKPSIAVLPFTNMSGDPEQEYFTDGITEDIITEMSRWRSLAVRSRSASFRYRGAAVDMKLVARELDVRFIVEGSVRRMGDRVRITAQLIDSETGSHVWAEKFDRETVDIFAAQDQVVRTIVSTLVGRVQVSDVERARRKPPTSLGAYECILQGNALAWDKPEGIAEASRLFEHAIEIDPGYGIAHALLAATCCSKWYDDFSGSDVLLQQAYAQAKRSVELDENESSCLSMLAFVCLLRRSFDVALQHADRAIEINPNNQWNNADKGLVLTYLGRPEDALDWFKRAREIDPYFDPPWYWRSVGQAHMGLRRYQQAVFMFDHASTGSYRISALKAGCLARLGDISGAESSAKDCLAMRHDFSIEMFMSKEPFKNPADAASQAESLRMAGLPD